MTTHQATMPCMSCGSWYRTGNACNICGAICADPPEETHRTSIGGGTGGRLWSKRLHRYLTAEEVKSGAKGG